MSRIASLILVMFMICIESAFGGVIEGTVKDMRSGAVLPRATIQLVASGRSTLANEAGEFRLVLPPGEHELKISHIGYHSQWKAVTLSDSLVSIEFSLPPAVIELHDLTVQSRAYDPAQAIIVEAIKRKQQILEKLNEYSFDAYSKLVVRDLSDDTAKIMLLTESQSTSFWQFPDKYKEVLTARRQSANLPAEANLVVVGEILNFNKNRLDLGEWEVVSPTADDALDFYNYYLLDSTMIDDRKVYQLQVEPRSAAVPLVVGLVQIVDSTFDVVGVDVGFNDVVDAPYLDSLRYRQQSALFTGEYWMPISVGFSALVEINFPGLPSQMSFDYVASLHSYSFETEAEQMEFDEYVLEVSEDADDIDSSAWLTRQTMPLTLDETRGYQYIDSVEQAPKPITKVMLRGLLAGAAMITVGDYDFFHFQRVDGPYLGLRLSFDPVEHARVWLSSGYGIDSKLWQHRYGARYDFDGRWDFSLSAEYRRQMVARQIIGREFYNPTFEALFFKYDPFDYYREQGYSLSAGLRLLPHLRLRAEFADYRQESAGVVTDYSFFGGTEPFRENPVITPGKMRKVGAALTFDSRRLWKNKGREVKLDETEYTTLEIGASYSSPDILASDFEFRKYYARLHYQRRMFGLGLTSLNLFAGSATRALPPQEYYTLGFDDPFVVTEQGFLTVGDSYFYGNRAFLANLSHDFGKNLWRHSGIPLVKDIPFTLGAHGGLFWTKFENHTAQPGDLLLRTATTRYSELGFSIGNLTPFIWPLNLAVYCTWQLSDYDTSDFTVLLGLRF
ncbi:MAG: DUF5686 family protein [bacterium]